MSERRYAVITGASSGIGYELAKCCALHGYDLLAVADEPTIKTAAQALSAHGTDVQAITADLATFEGAEKIRAAIGIRPVDALIANAGRGSGKGPLNQEFGEIQRAIDTNISGTLYLLHKIGHDMRARGTGRILITGSIAPFMPGTFQAVYDGSKAFLNSFSAALRNELKDSGVTVTCLMPPLVATESYGSAELLDSGSGHATKGDSAIVAREGFDAMMKGESEVADRKAVAAARLMPSAVLVEKRRASTEPASTEHLLEG